MFKKIDNSIRKTIASSVESTKPYITPTLCFRLAYITFALFVIVAVVVVYLFIIAPITNKSNISNYSGNPSPTMLPTKVTIPVISQIGFYHTSGNQLVDIYGKPARISSVNW